MSYVVNKSGSGYKVFKKGSSKSFSKKPLTKEKAEAQQKALYANESLDTSKVGTNLQFKGIYPTIDEQEASVSYKVNSEKNTTLTVVYSVGSAPGDCDYKYLIIRDHNDPKGRPQKIEDPHSEEAKKLLSVYDLTSEDIEMAGQDGYDKLAEYLSKENTIANSFEESFEFEALYSKIFSE